MSIAYRPPAVAGLRLLRLVGSGGEGEVWEARTAAGQRRALKLVRPAAMAAPEQVVARGDWLRRIEHPALVRVRRTGMLAEPGLDGWGLVEMDFVDGRDLSRAVADRDVLDRLRPLAAGLDDLHDGVWSGGTPLVHRDIKPANLIAVPDGRIVLVDCSSLCGVDRSLLTRIGTPLFAAPEVMTGRIGPAADVYSFAATVVALTSGARGDRLAAHLHDPWSLDIPDPVRLALAADPRRRPRRCALLLDPEVVRLTDVLPREDAWLPPEIGVASDAQVPPAPQDTGTSDLGRIPERAGGNGWLASAGLAADGAPSSFPHVSPPPVNDGWMDVALVGGQPADAAGIPAVPVPPPRAAWPFLVLLAGVGVLLAGAAIDPAQLGASWTVTAFALSVIAHLGARRPLLPALVVPTVSWAFLLAERASGDETRRAWVRTTLAGLLTGASAMGVTAIGQAGAAASAELLAALVAVGVAVTVGVVAIARAGGLGGVGSRIVLAPLTAAGALVLAAGAVLSALIAALAGRPSGPGWLGRQALRGIAAIAVFGHEAAGDDDSPDEESGFDGPSSAAGALDGDGAGWRGAGWRGADGRGADGRVAGGRGAGGGRPDDRRST